MFWKIFDVIFGHLLAVAYFRRKHRKFRGGEKFGRKFTRTHWPKIIGSQKTQRSKHIRTMFETLERFEIYFDTKCMKCNHELVGVFDKPQKPLNTIICCTYRDVESIYIHTPVWHECSQCIYIWEMLRSDSFYIATTFGVY